MKYIFLPLLIIGILATQVVVDYNKEPYQALRDVLGQSGI